MVRGIERTTIFHDDPDRTDFVARLASLAEAGAWTIYAWALLPNHAAAISGWANIPGPVTAPCWGPCLAPGRTPGPS